MLLWLEIPQDVPLSAAVNVIKPPTSATVNSWDSEVTISDPVPITPDYTWETAYYNSKGEVDILLSVGTLLDLYAEYEAECFADSTLIYEYYIKFDGKEWGVGPSRRTYRQPTFQGFMEFLKKRNRPGE